MGSYKKEQFRFYRASSLGLAVNSKPGFGALMSRACARHPSMNLAKIAPLKL